MAKANDTPRAKLGKQYSNWTGRRFQRVLVTGPDGREHTYDVMVREERSGFYLMSNMDAKAEALRRFAAGAAY